MNRKSIIVALFCAILSVLGCGKSADQDSNHPASRAAKDTELQIIRLGHLPIADCAQLFVGLEKYFFEQQGIRIERIALANGVKILQALSTGDIDIGFSAVVPLIMANSQNIKLVALTGGPTEDLEHPEHAVLVTNVSSIRHPKDLEGKAVGIVGFRSIDEPYIKEWLDQNGTNVQEVDFYEIRFPQMEPTLLTGQIDAIASIEPFVTAARLNGKTRVIGNHFTEVHATVEIASYNAKRSWAETHSDLVKRFRIAFDKATEYANSHPAEVKQIVTRYTKLSPDLAEQMTLPLFSKRLSTDGLQAVMALMQKWQIIEEPINIDSVVFP